MICEPEHKSTQSLQDSFKSLQLLMYYLSHVSSWKFFLSLQMQFPVGEALNLSRSVESKGTYEQIEEAENTSPDLIIRVVG